MVVEYFSKCWIFTLRSLARIRIIICISRFLNTGRKHSLIIRGSLGCITLPENMSGYESFSIKRELILLIRLLLLHHFRRHICFISNPDASQWTMSE